MDDLNHPIILPSGSGNTETTTKSTTEQARAASAAMTQQIQEQDSHVDIDGVVSPETLNRDVGGNTQNIKDGGVNTQNIKKDRPSLQTLKRDVNRDGGLPQTRKRNGDINQILRRDGGFQQILNRDGGVPQANINDDAEMADQFQADNATDKAQSDLAIRRQLEMQDICEWNQIPDDADPLLEFDEIDTSNIDNKDLVGRSSNPLRSEGLQGTNDGPPAVSQTALQDSDVKTQADAGHKYAKLLQKSYGDVAYELYHTLVRKSIAGHGSVDEESFVSATTRVLGTMPTSIIQELLGGNMATAVKENRGGIRDIVVDWEALDLDDSEYKHKPLVYYRVLVDDHGRPPTPAQWRTVLRYLEKYKTDVHVASYIDSEAPGWAGVGGGRRYNTDVVAGSLEKFCSALRKRLAPIQGDSMHDPLEPPMGYIGLTVNNRAQRKLDDSHNKASDALMSLVSSACRRYLVNHDGSHEPVFGMQHFIIHFANLPRHGSVARILFTELTGCYAVDGMGFTDNALVENPSFDRFTKAYWDWIVGWAFDHTPFHVNMAAWKTRDDALQAEEEEFIREFEQAKNELREQQAQLEKSKAKRDQEEQITVGLLLQYINQVHRDMARLTANQATRLRLTREFIQQVDDMHQTLLKKLDALKME